MSTMCSWLHERVVDSCIRHGPQRPFVFAQDAEDLSYPNALCEWTGASYPAPRSSACASFQVQLNTCESTYLFLPDCPSSSAPSDFHSKAHGFGKHISPAAQVHWTTVGIGKLVALHIPFAALPSRPSRSVFPLVLFTVFLLLRL